MWQQKTTVPSYHTLYCVVHSSAHLLWVMANQNISESQFFSPAHPHITFTCRYTIYSPSFLNRKKKKSIWLKPGIIVSIDITRMCTEVYSRSDWATTLTPEQGSPGPRYAVFKWTVECYYISKLTFSAGSHVKFFEGQNWSTLAKKIEKSLPQSDHGVKEWKVLLMLR